MSWLFSLFRRPSYTNSEMIEMVSRGMQVRRVNGHNYKLFLPSIRFRRRRRYKKRI